MTLVVIIYIILLIIFLIVSGLIFRHTIKFSYLSSKFKIVASTFGLIAFIIIIFSFYLILQISSSNSSDIYNNYNNTPSYNEDFGEINF